MYAYSLYTNYVETTPVRADAQDWSEFVLQMAGLVAQRAATDRVKKYATPAISPALYAPGSVRSNAGVTGWGGWCALDVDNDLTYVGVDAARTYLDDLGLRYLIYTSTKSRPDHHRYRVVLPLSRWPSQGEAQDVWKAITQALGSLGADAACKDISRIYGAPSHWMADDDGNTDPYNAFEVSLEGRAVDVDAVLATYVRPVEPVFDPARIVAQVAPEPTTRRRKRKALPSHHTLMDSPVVAGAYVEDYLALVQGEHHVGLYRFMTRVIGRASSQGYDLTPTDVLQYCRELDALSPFKRDAERWKRIPSEIANAFAFSHRPY